MERLKRRILREFERKLLVGDIAVSDEQYELLLEHLRSVYSRLSVSYYEIHR